MKYNNKASLAKLSRLYKLASDLAKLKCWDWMLDSDIFGVKNPVDNKVGYCCIMGKLGRFKGLAVYLGTEGLESYLNICSGKLEAGSFESLLNQKCLMLSYGNINELELEDLNIIEYLKYSFNENEFPLFRNYQPGYLPWFINEYDTDFLILVLEQVIDVVLRAKENKSFLEADNKSFLVKVQNKNEWFDEYIEPVKIPVKSLKPIIDIDLLKKLELLNLKQEGSWNIVSVNIPTAIRENEERPYYPYVLIISDKDSDSPLGFEISEYNKIFTKYPSVLIKTMIENNFIPEKIFLFQHEIKELIKPITDKFKIKVNTNKNPGKMKPVIEQIINIINSEDPKVIDLTSD